MIIKLENIERTFNKNINVLKGVNVKFELGKFYIIMGHSGNGKSTLLNILGLLDLGYTGDYYLNNKLTKDLSLSELSNIRNKKVGFVFQDYYLDDKLTALENVLLPTIINKDISSKDAKTKAIDLLNKFGLDKRTNHLPSTLSGGEKQRVAIIRAIINDPDIILAFYLKNEEKIKRIIKKCEEILDAESEEKVMSILKDISNKGKCVIMVTHNTDLIKYADKVYNLENGVLNEK